MEYRTLEIGRPGSGINWGPLPVRYYQLAARLDERQTAVFD
jgi:hypothetical protein